MADNGITIVGLQQYSDGLQKLTTENPAMKRHLQEAIRKIINEARKRIIQDAKGVLENDPRNAYKAVRSSVYKQILGGQVNILSSRKRGTPTKYQRPKKEREQNARGGNRRPRSMRTMQLDSYEGKDRGFILRFQNAGTVERETRFGNRGSLRARHWFGTSSAFHVQQAVDETVEMIENILQQEFQLI